MNSLAAKKVYNKAISDLIYFLYEKKRPLLNLFFIRKLYFFFTIFKYILHRYITTNYYLALSALLKYDRDLISDHSNRNNLRLILNLIVKDKTNRVLRYYVNTQEAKNYRKQFIGYGLYNLVRIRYPKKDEDLNRQGELLVLKPYISSKEKGVLLINYDEGVKKFISIFDVDNLAKYYRIVVEPSTCDYQNPMLFLLFGIETDVIFESQFDPDFKYISKIGLNFYPIRIGAGDWVNVEQYRFIDNQEKIYDFVMIANWMRWKRHDLFFRSLSKIKSHVKKCALIGYPLIGETIDNIIRLSKKYGVFENIEFYERIPHIDVFKILTKSKIGVLLSKEEGANRGIYECFFSNVPVILSKENRGVNRKHINECTGICAGDKELPDVMLYMLNNYQNYKPRVWAIKNTGYINTTLKVNELIKKNALEQGEVWTQDIFQKHNSPHGRYANIKEQSRADQEFAHLEKFLR